MTETLAKLTTRHCAALFFGKFLKLIDQGSAVFIEDQGTMTFISFEGQCYGITNQHVVGERYRRPTPDKVFLLALDKHGPLPGELLFKLTKDDPDYPYDVAVFALDESAIVRGGKLPIILQPGSAPLDPGEVALAVGFPGSERGAQDYGYMVHPLAHVAATCQNASDRTIVLRDDLYVDQESLAFGGMSGGPIYKLTGATSYHLAGIVFQGEATRTDASQPTYDIWIWGFPLSYEIFASMLEHRGGGT